MKITLDIPIGLALRLRNLAALLRTDNPDVAGLKAELHKHGIDLTQIKFP
jgi:hypothetical protein